MTRFKSYPSSTSNAASACAMDVSALQQLSAASDQGICLCELVRDADGQFIDYRYLQVNDAFGRITRLPRVEGRTVRDLAPGVEQVWIDTFVSLALGDSPRRFRLGSHAINRKFEVFAVPLDGHRFIAQLRDVTDEELMEHERAQALEQAAALLDELNHRVMNSLSIIGAIISMEVRALRDETGKAPLRRIGQRVNAVAELYKSLNAGSSANEVCAGKYIRQVVANVAGSIAPLARVQVDTDVVEMRLSSRGAAPLGLMVNELVTNALKYAFKPDQSGRVMVRLQRGEGDELCLSVADNGIGIDNGRVPESGVGRNLVRAFAIQLNGSVSTESGADGTTVTVRFRPDQPPSE